MIDDELLHKWINGTLSESELATFKERPEYESLKSLYSNTEHLSGPSFDQNSMLKNILKHESSKTSENATKLQEAKKSKVISLFLKIAVAASTLFLIGTFLFSSDHTIANNSIAEMSHQLPNGSEVKLFPGSEYSIDEKAWDQARNVKMKGKAYFNVTKGKKFTIHSGKGRIEVLGTSFLVNAKENFTVSCDEGTVEVHSNKSKARAKIFAGESFSILDSGGRILNKKGLTKLTNLPLKLILEEITKVFEVEFDTGNLDLKQELTSGFQHDNLENAIKTIAIPLKIQYVIEGGQVILTK